MLQNNSASEYHNGSRSNGIAHGGPNEGIDNPAHVVSDPNSNGTPKVLQIPMYPLPTKSTESSINPVIASNKDEKALTRPRVEISSCCLRCLIAVIVIGVILMICAAAGLGLWLGYFSRDDSVTTTIPTTATTTCTSTSTSTTTAKVETTTKTTTATTTKTTTETTTKITTETTTKTTTEATTKTTTEATTKTTTETTTETRREETTSFACPTGNYRCSNGLCISQSWLCDGDNDCGNGEDENPIYCNGTCHTGLTRCSEDGSCIHSFRVCNGVRNCPQGSDERNCYATTTRSTPPPCLTGYYRCANGLCIRQSWLCDGDNDCGNGEDENPIYCNATTTRPTQAPCPTGYYRCSNGLCISQSWLCDGDDDCGNGEDENPIYCNGTCRIGLTRCSEDGSCIHSRLVCNGVRNCPQGSDERNCSACPVGQYRCVNDRCISQSWLCDGGNDCGNGEDENPIYCNGTCRTWLTRCSEDGSCIRSFRVCDGVRDCPQGSDERNCNVTTTTLRPTLPPLGPITSFNGSTTLNYSIPCNYRRFKCPNPLYGCIPVAWRCDGVNDCGDGSDEANCPCDHRTQFNCQSTPARCINRTQLCDGRNDCPYDFRRRAYLDESYCSSSSYCSSYYYIRCDRICLPRSQACRGLNFCSDHRDKIDCSCTSMQTRCRDGNGCIEARKWCNGQRDCRDGSDEEPGCKEEPCPNRGRRCPADGSCINPSMICDRINDCPDGSDEKNCTNGCRYSEFTCNDGRCIDQDWTCDGIKDCSNGEDERLRSCTACNNTTQFQCVSNRTCVSVMSRCDGYSNCVDGSDEAQCVNIGADGPHNPGDSTRPVQITYRGQQGYSLCADNWNTAWSDLLCKQLGYKESQTTVTNLGAPANQRFLKVNSILPSSLPVIRQLYNTVTGGCSSNTSIGISCKLSECGVRRILGSSPAPSIVNGQEAARGAWPWQVFLELTFPSYKGSCGGSLISDRWVLTAAHCVESISNASDIKVLIGCTEIYGINSECVNITANNFIMHPSYAHVPLRNVIINDVALIRLSSPVTFTDTIQPICLARPGLDLNKFKVCMATGWGRRRHEYIDIPNTMRQGKMKLRTTDECYRSYRQLSYGSNWTASISDFEYILCAGNTLPFGGVDTCQGDSGGPLACQNQQGIWINVGVTSFGFRTCDMSVFARVSTYFSWIISQMSP